MSLLIPILIILAIAAVAFWAVDQLGTPSPLNNIAKVVIVIVAVIAMAQRAGYAVI